MRSPLGINDVTIHGRVRLKKNMARRGIIAWYESNEGKKGEDKISEVVTAIESETKENPKGRARKRER